MDGRRKKEQRKEKIKMDGRRIKEQEGRRKYKWMVEE